jgi:hypothetical protein
MPLIDVVSKASMVAPEQTGATASNVGVVFGFNVTATAVRGLSQVVVCET